jgi:16S rRNA (guanine527-N7)-methyltransferase
VTGSDFRERLIERADRANVAIGPTELPKLDAYFQALATWNRTINLTALPLDPPSDEAIDRLFVEPIAAAAWIRRCPDIVGAPAPRWVDLGSGGGSPAIPMKIALLAFRLVMVESKSRKAAFLREVARTLALDGAEVINCRFDEMGEPALADLVTVRGVRLDEEFSEVAARLLRDGGTLATFATSDIGFVAREFSSGGATPLLDERSSWLHLYRRVPRGTSRLQTG